MTPADFVSYSALRVDATRVGNGTFRIHGSVYVRGNWEFHGNSRQLNDRPTSEGDRAPYDNQTFVCSDLVLTGNPQIGEASRPMLAVHIAGDVRGAGRAYEIHALLQDKVVPDIRLGAVDLAIQCIRGLVENEACQQNGGGRLGEFAGLWDSYTNDLDGQDLVVFRPPSGAETTWQRDWTQSRNLTVGTRAWRIPKRGQADRCKSASAALDQVLQACAAYYDGAGNLYVAARQVLYIPGALSVNRDVDYRVDDNPTQACNPAAGEQADPCKKGDGSMFVVACEAGTPCDPGRSSPAYGFDVQEMLRAHRKASNGFYYSDTTFPSHDLLAVLVNGRVRFGLSGNPSQQEINLVVVSGCRANLVPDRCDLTMQKNLQLYGSVISRLLVFEQNVDLFQVPDLRRYLPFALDRFLNAPGGAAVVVTSWREIGF